MHATLSRKPTQSKADKQSEGKGRLSSSQFGHDTGSTVNDVVMQNPLRGDSGNPETLQRKNIVQESNSIEIDFKEVNNFNDALSSLNTNQIGKEATVNARYGNLAKGVVSVRRNGHRYILGKKNKIPISHPFFSQLNQKESAIIPYLILSTTKEGVLSGFIGLESSDKRIALTNKLKKFPELLGLNGFSIPNYKFINKLENKQLKFGLNKTAFNFGRSFKGDIDFYFINEIIIFNANANVNISGLGSGTLMLTRDDKSLITGTATIETTLSKEISGNIKIDWDGKNITGEGKVAYEGEKLSGDITLILMDKKQALQLKEEEKTPALVSKQVIEGENKQSKDINFVVFGSGTLNFSFNEWLNGNANVIIDPKGYVTVIGQITPQAEFELFPQKNYRKELFKIEARAIYGVPVVGNIFIFGNISMDAFAKVGPGKFHKIVVNGSYSTDPKKKNNFSIQGSFNVSAVAGLQLRGEAGAGLEILDHDIKAGAGINAIAAIRGYAEATPIVGYREKGAEGEDKKGEFFIRGELEVAGQPFLGLSGEVFVELDSPWWSPAPDKKWTWPLGNKEWSVGGDFGIKASVDYVFGSDQAPTIEFNPVAFSADKFLTDIYSDKPLASGEGASEKLATWKEKNKKEAEIPSKKDNKNGVSNKKSEKPPKAQASNKIGSQNTKKKADPNDKTASGKSVKKLQNETQINKGKLKNNSSNNKGAIQKNNLSKKSTKKTHDQKLKKGLDALDALTKKYDKKGATLKEIKTGIKAVRRKFKVFKSIDIIDEGGRWYYKYIASKGVALGPKIKNNRLTDVKIVNVSAFNPKKKYSDYIKEYKRQVHGQEKGLNKINIYDFLLNTEKYKTKSGNEVFTKDERIIAKLEDLVTRKQIKGYNPFTKKNVKESSLRSIVNKYYKKHFNGKNLNKDEFEKKKRKLLDKIENDNDQRTISKILVNLWLYATKDLERINNGGHHYSTAVLHNPDMIAGGDPLPDDVGWGSINSSIGSNWKANNRSRVREIHKAIEVWIVENNLEIKKTDTKDEKDRKKNTMLNRKINVNLEPD